MGWTCFQIVEYEKAETKNSTVEKSGKHYSGHVFNLTIGDKSC